MVCSNTKFLINISFHLRPGGQEKVNISFGEKKKQPKVANGIPVLQCPDLGT